jgi:4-hydroxy-tetrahydrodipicolinate synthase
MGGDGGTLSSAGVVPEVLMKIYRESLAGNWAESRRLQFKLLALFSIMVGAPSLLDGFRAGYEARGFHPGAARFPMSSQELATMETVRSRVACVLSECGFSEAASACQNAVDVPDGDLRATVEAIVRSVVAARP